MSSSLMAGDRSMSSRPLMPPWVGREGSADDHCLGSGLNGFIGYLGGPQVGAEDFVADAVGGYAAVEQGGADVPHERQRPAGEDLNVRRQRDLGEVHETLVGAVVVGSDGFVPGVGGEVVELSSDVQDRVAEGVVLGGAVGVGDDDGAVGSGCGRYVPRWAARW
jgi:hypothetical protein